MIKRGGPRGLPAIARAREERAEGRGRWTMQAGLVAAGAVAAALIVHTVVDARDRKASKESLLSKQRAVAVTLGAQWFPMRDALEAYVLDAAKPAYAGDMIDPQARAGQFRTQPGIYLRMRLAQATSAASVRETAASSKKDGFVACFLREPNERGVRGEIDGGAFAEQPWNLGQAYTATHILTDAWAQDVRDADDDMRLRVLQGQYDQAVRDQIPMAVDLTARAQFFLLVLDEDSAEAAALTDGGPMTETALQLVGHPARVHLFDLKARREILRLRRSGEAQVVPAGERVVDDPETREAMQRQANNCSLARNVDAALSAPAAHP
jgi:hypothetical protein